MPDSDVPTETGYFRILERTVVHSLNNLNPEEARKPEEHEYRRHYVEGFYSSKSLRSITWIFVYPSRLSLSPSPPRPLFSPLPMSSLTFVLRETSYRCLRRTVISSCAKLCISLLFLILSENWLHHGPQENFYATETYRWTKKKSININSQSFDNYTCQYYYYYLSDLWNDSIVYRFCCMSQCKI